MKSIFKYHLYVFGFAILIAAAILFNKDCPPNFDETYAWLLAKHLSPNEIFIISKNEGHPFLWYYILMPLAKNDFFFPISLYTLNLLIILAAAFFLYHNAPFPNYIKYLITLSSPFLFYTAFARSYSLSILLLFLILSIYPSRHTKIYWYLTFIILLANTHILGLFAAFALGFCYLLECLQHFKNTPSQINPIITTLNFALFETVLFILQFYGYDSNTPLHTPVFETTYEALNQALHPLNLWLFTLLLCWISYIFYQQKRFFALAFLIITITSQILFFSLIYHGTAHHYRYIFIYCIAAFWLAAKEKSPSLSTKNLLPFTILTIFLIFNFNYNYKTKDKHYLQNLQQNAAELNALFPTEPTEIISFDHFNTYIILPYLNSNITLLNQTTTPLHTLKAFQEKLYPFYIRINIHKIISKARKNKKLLLYRQCGSPSYYNNSITFNLKHRLTGNYCLYTVNIKTSSASSN